MSVAAYAMHHPWVGLVAVACVVAIMFGFVMVLSSGGQDG